MKKSFFLEEVVDYTFKKYKDFRNLTIIFPNRRAGLYFQKALSKKLDKPLWSPTVKTLEDFVQEFSNIKISDDVSDSIVINHYLYKIIQKIQDKDSRVSFDEFYYWGQILINDFNDIDQSLKDESKVFRVIKNQKEIDESFNFLENENLERIKSFWKKFFPKMSVNQKNFRKTWKILLNVYKDFTKILKKNKIGYKGLVYKEFLKNITSGIVNSEREYLFVGFNVLYNSEKKIIKYFIKEHKSMAFWDFDSYYFNDYKQEAGDAFRDFSDDKILNSTFPKVIPNNFHNVKKTIKSIGIGSQVGQCKVLGNILTKKVREKNFDQDKVLILLPDEKLLLPVLNSIPDSIKNINVTMGLSLSDTPLYSLVQIIYKVYNRCTNRDYNRVSYFEEVIELLYHPYIYQYNSKLFDKFILEIRENKFLYIKHKNLIGLSDILSALFSSESSIIKNIRNVCNYLFKFSKDLGKLDKEYIKSFLEILDKLIKINIEFKSLENQSKLLNQILKIIRIPFSGEPLSGLQIMGVLESRNLDFDEVYILSMNEGDFPKSIYSVSFIPFNIRKAFKLDTSDSMDKVFSYLFYRVIQRSKDITLIHNTSSNFTNKGEKSRFIKQLQSESGIKIKNISVSENLELSSKSKLVIDKNKDIIDKLSNRFFIGGYISPSGIKDYMDCSLRFYYKYVANIRELNTLSKEILKPDFGKITHKALELLYIDIKKKQPKWIINKNDFFRIKSTISGALELAIRKHFRLKKKNELKLEGNNIILTEIMKKYISDTISLDEKYAPFQIIDLEGNKNSGYIKKINLSNNLSVKISGIVDRVDKKNDNYRIIDYKTGGDTKKIKAIEMLFSDKKNERNDAVFQLFYYSLLLKEKLKNNSSITPGLINIREMNNQNFAINIFINNEKVDDINCHLEKFEDLLKSKLNDIFDINTPFVETDNKENCKFCAYKKLCTS